jgi:LysR family hydrogen peroxide-inducible transcriptional activator
MPTLTQLEYVLSVDKHRHFGKASRASNVSQPTMSQQIQKIEDELQIVIFDRIQKPVIPTKEGKKFIEQAKVVVREHQRLIHMSRKGSEGLTGDFHLGIIPTVASFLVPLFVRGFSQAYPDVELFIEELKTESILADLRNDRLDGAILATPIPQLGLKEHPLFYESFLLYLSNGHPLLKKKTLDDSDLDGSEMWMLQDGNCFKNQVANFCSISSEQDTVLKNIHFQSGSLETLRNLVRRSQGYTMIPSLMTLAMSAEEKKSHLRPFKNPVPTREVSFVYRRDHWKLEIIDAIEKSIAASLPSEVSREKAGNQLILEHC